MNARFIITASEGTVAGTYHDQVVDAKNVVIGREDRADVVLPDPSVSRQHAKVQVTKQGWCIEDLGSRQGTRLNNKRLHPGLAVPLRKRDEISVGPYLLVFLLAPQGPAEADTRAVARALARRLTSGDRPRSEPAYLQVENGPARGTRFVLQPGSEMRLGRGRGCELLVDDARISRQHAVLHNQGGEVHITDASSTNGCYVNKVRVQNAVRLEDGNLIAVGRIRLVFVDPRKRIPGWTCVPKTAERPGFSGWLSPALALVTGLLGMAAAMFL